MENLRDYPELTPFVVSNVRPTGRTIGAGAYGSVDEVSIPGAICAAKRMHHVLAVGIGGEEAMSNFVRECRLMSMLRHPNIVQFLGLCILPDSPMPVILMERLMMSLHELLESRGPNHQFFPMSLKCSILHNVASGLAYLHGQSPPIIHRDLTARNVLLNSGMVAKIADLGTARILLNPRIAAAMTRAPGNLVYMPPEAISNRASEREHDQRQAQYDTGIDIFSFGVVSLFTLTQTFPCDLLPSTYINRDGELTARTELHRRDMYMTLLYRELPQNHRFLQLVEGCLDFPHRRPSVQQILHVLEQARAEEVDDLIGMNKLEMMGALHVHPSSQVRVL